MDIQHQILEKMKAYDTIMLFRHSRVDGDCVGATKGMKALIQASFPDKKVLIVDDEHSDYLAFLGEDDAPVADDVYAQSLAIVLDVSVASRISNPKYALCKELVKLDHHINVEPYGDLMWVEEERSSACEMVADFYDKCRDELTLTKDAALYLYTGMVTDSGRFRYDAVNARTFRLAAFLREQPFDTNELYNHLYAMDYEQVRLRAQFALKICFTPHHVAYIYTTQEEKEQYHADDFAISRGMVNVMSDISGVHIRVNFTESDKGVLCELRSDRVNINPIAVSFGGGGHQKASGATVADRETAMEMLESLDKLAEEMK